MSAWIEIIMPGSQRCYVKASSVERIVLPAGLTSTDIAHPEDPMRLVLRDGASISCINQTAMHLLYGITTETAAVSKAEDGQEAG